MDQPTIVEVAKTNRKRKLADPGSKKTKKTLKMERLTLNAEAQKLLKLGDVVKWEYDDKSVHYGMVKGIRGKEHVLVYSMANPKTSVFGHTQSVECAEVTKV
jgi:hypothetical protein